MSDSMPLEATAAALLSRNDERFLALARELDEEDWAAPSLCAEWTNHQVLAHLTVGYGAPVREIVREMVATRGTFDIANRALACKMAEQRTPVQLLEDFESLIAEPRGIGVVFPKRLLLGDHVIHELDIVFALGREATITDESIRAVLQTEVSIPNPFVPAGRRAKGLNLYATDVAWRHSDAPRSIGMVNGAAADLASVLAGRAHALSRLSGSGVEELRARIS